MQSKPDNACEVKDLGKTIVDKNAYVTEQMQQGTRQLTRA